MRVASAWSVHPDPRVAAREAHARLVQRLGSAPQLMVVHASCLYDGEALCGELRSLAKQSPLMGGTSCLGVMTEEGLHSQDGRGVGILGLADAEGSYGAGISECADDPAAAARAAVDAALVQAGRAGEVPVAILVTNTPGHEEQVIRAIEEHVGSGVPIIGGTSADNDMSGQWRQFGNDAVTRQGVAVATLFPSGEVGYAFHSGYEPTARRGRATRARDRLLCELDGRPAARVYNEWTGGSIEEVLAARGGSLVPAATFSPIGNPVGQVGGVPYYRLSYPVEVRPDESLLLFTDVQEGSELVLMRGTHQSLLSRPGRVAAAALESAPFDPAECRGALVLFCTGCMLAVRDRIAESLDGLRLALGDAPFLVSFTLGEQGCFIGGENRHGNLMIAVLALGPSAPE